jgi:folate-binding protein YgfZ
MVTAPLLPGYDAARESCASYGRSREAWVVVSGRDRGSYLQGLLTNDVGALKAGEGCYSAYLTPQGRMITDMAVHELGDVLLLMLPAATREAVLAKLDQFIFSEDVQLGDVTDTFTAVSLVGPESASAVARLAQVDAAVVSALPLYGNRRVTFNGSPAILLRAGDRGELAFDLLVERPQQAALHDALLSAGIVAMSDEAAEAVRIEAGVPRFQQDMTDETIPLEAGIEGRAISFNKGCYVGQEVIIRVLHRGHGRVAKKLVGLRLQGEIFPVAGSAIEGGGKAPGVVTSAAWSPRFEQPIALGYVHRELAEPGTRVTVAGSDAVVSALPFQQ